MTGQGVLRAHGGPELSWDIGLERTFGVVASDVGFGTTGKSESTVIVQRFVKTQKQRPW